MKPTGRRRRIEIQAYLKNTWFLCDAVEFNRRENSIGGERKRSRRILLNKISQGSETLLHFLHDSRVFKCFQYFEHPSIHFFSNDPLKLFSFSTYGNARLKMAQSRGNENFYWRSNEELIDTEYISIFFSLPLLFTFPFLPRDLFNLPKLAIFIFSEESFLMSVGFVPKVCEFLFLLSLILTEFPNLRSWCKEIN